MGSKDSEFNVDFKNINLPKWQSSPIKVIPDKRISYIQYTGGPLCSVEIRLSGITFF
jgi:hypothetical protein